MSVAGRRVALLRHFRMFSGIEETVPPPPNPSKPGLGSCHRRYVLPSPNRYGPCSNPRPPTIEPEAGRAGIETTRAAHVFPPIHEHIHERMAHLARRGKAPRVVAIAPHAAAPSENAVDRPCQPNREPAGAA